MGKLTDKETVLSFAKDCDVVTIEIENVSTEALKVLEQQGKRVFPPSSVIELIQDKRLQKKFYQTNSYPTADFVLVNNREEVMRHEEFLPAVNKLGKEGYDGRGVQIIESKQALSKAFDQPGILEKLVDFEKEISIIVSRNLSGEIEVYDPVEMEFHPEKNLVEYLFAPASISEDVKIEAQQLARDIVYKLDMVGILAIEMFVTKDQKILINEMAPRPHNSGHHSIEACTTSQYEQHLRAILNLPPGDPTLIIPAAMVNLLGEPGYEGEAKYQGVEEVMNIAGAHLHLYGKALTKPYRKMGHVTITDYDHNQLRRKAEKVKKTLKVVA